MVSEVYEFVGDDVVDQRERRLHDAPVQAHEAVGCAATPPLLLRRQDDLGLLDAHPPRPEPCALAQARICVLAEPPYEALAHSNRAVSRPEPGSYRHDEPAVIKPRWS